MAGHKLMRKLPKRASESGHTPSQERLAKPTAFQGVGAGQPTARWKVIVPSAVQTTTGPQLLEFGATAVEGAEGEDLPLIYGLDGMEKKNGAHAWPGQLLGVKQQANRAQLHTRDGSTAKGHAFNIEATVLQYWAMPSL